MDLLAHSQEVIVSSAKRVSGTDENFTYALALDSKEYTHVVCQQAYIPLSYYLILPDDVFFLTEDAGEIEIALTAGNYGRTTIAIALQAALNAAGSNTYTITTPVGTGHLIFTNVGGSAQPVFRFPVDGDDAIARAMGFSAGVSYPFAGDVLESVHVQDLILENTLVINSELVNGSILQPLFASADSIPFGAIRYQNTTGLLSARKIASGLERSEGINFYLSDENRRPSHSLNGVSWVMSLLFFRVPSPPRPPRLPNPLSPLPPPPPAPPAPPQAEDLPIARKEST